ncbi:hypothetical protein M427DRAFT_374143 [Gonapodya prolifera JEL478]|uniref:Uncharacterized protein n=1 Tax=Gonapodya prolifera (strain JEL478) TaxID=1344416 RepID=A0A139AUH3_GONPJ|nr:hypothetical protein M427DRAFT_374143 [Gonapodya prolifera JEL478]|eukprot:KXS20381.1 hypothetical protein M427DRAFT_374143 [Gonapodya prolifera JEL478]
MMAQRVQWDFWDADADWMQIARSGRWRVPKWNMEFCQQWRIHCQCNLAGHGNETTSHNYCQICPFSRYRHNPPARMHAMAFPLSCIAPLASRAPATPPSGRRRSRPTSTADFCPKGLYSFMITLIECLTMTSVRAILVLVSPARCSTNAPEDEFNPSPPRQEPRNGIQYFGASDGVATAVSGCRSGNVSWNIGERVPRQQHNPIRDEHEDKVELKYFCRPCD